MPNVRLVSVSWSFLNLDLILFCRNNGLSGFLVLYAISHFVMLRRDDCCFVDSSKSHGRLVLPLTSKSVTAWTSARMTSIIRRAVGQSAAKADGAIRFFLLLHAHSRAGEMS
jgi:hypothetical protein